MRLGELTANQLAERLRHGGLFLQTGPFLSQIHSRLPSVREALRFGYADFPLVEDERFADFHVRVAPPRGLRRWVRPQVLFQIDGAVAFAPYPLRLAAPILEWGLNWCVAVRAHQYLLIHAAVLERGGRALLLCGASGAGKSTLCAAAVLRGWRLLSDEITIVRPRDGLVVPLPRPISLKNASIEVIRRFASDVPLGPAWSDTAKGTVAHLRPPTASVQRAQETARPGCVVFVQFEADAPLVSSPVPKAAALMQLADNSFNYSMLGLQGFQTMAQLVDQCACVLLRYGQLDAALEQLDRLVDEGNRGGGAP